MLRQRTTHTLVISVVLFNSLACIIPGLQPAVAVPPTMMPLDIVIANTASAAQTQTHQANPVGQATVTETSTIAPVTTPTPIISINGTSLVVREDQSTVFTDHKAGIELVIPAGWLAIRVNEPEYYAAFTNDAILANPVMMKHLTTIQDANLNVARLDVMDIREGHSPDGSLNVISIVFVKGDMWSLEECENVEKSRFLPYIGFKLIGTSYSQTTNGTRVLVSEKTWDGAGENTVYYRGIFFSLPSGMVVIHLYSTLSLNDTVLPEIEQIMNSVKPLNP